MPAAYTRIANRLSHLIHDVREIRIDRDEKREIFTLYARDAEGTLHPARALSDGTLRFLALAVVEMDPEIEGVLCLEEPENGIHPARIPAILELLQDIAVDTHIPAGTDNPLRQVIINTHSPAVFQEVPDASVVFTKARETAEDHRHLFKAAHFYHLSNTWRSKGKENSDQIAPGDLLAYLNPVLPKDSARPANEKRVVDREDMRQLLPFHPPVR